MTKAEIQQVKLRFGIIGNNEALMRAIDIAIQVAPTDLSVLITGESGVGKESFPQIIHQYSRRKHGQYIAVNCGAIPEGTIDSELFGHEKGAFTGAIGERKGYFGEANGGTIFLDEVGELPLPTQARLLRVLESGEFIKVGSSKVEKTDVRIVAATNVNLTQAIADGRFREDLYYRLNTVPIQVPPLRERGEDVVLLFRKFASDFAEKYRMPAIQLTEDGKQVLLGYSWPGNVRQLKNITEQISIIETNREINASILKGYLPEQNNMQRLPALFGVKEDKSFGSEREILYQVLFDMRQDVTDLKKLVHEIMAERGTVANPAVATSAYYTPATPAVVPPVTSSVPTIIHPSVKPVTPVDDDFQDTEEYVEESLSLDEVEKEMIRKALEKHHGKRKSAAQDLNISERTLYRKIKEYGLVSLLFLVNSCSMKLGLAPISSIDYTKVKTISIADFQNRAEYVYAPLATEFNQKMKDMFIQQTRLQLVNSGGDLEIDGEITGYNQYNESVDASGYSSKVKVTLTVNVRYTNNTNHEEDFEQQFSAFQTYDSSKLLTEVQDQLITLMVKDIAEQIFNATVANW